MTLTDDQLMALETAIEEAFASGDHSHLTVLGYGEVSSVIAWPGVDGRVACKRLPVFTDRERFEAYRRCSSEYLARLAERGVEVVTTEVRAIDKPGGQVAGYCLQPVLPAETLGPRVFAASPARAPTLFATLLEHIVQCVSPTLGLDGQLSNWAIDASGRPVYLDVSTPLMRDRAGREALDTDLFLSSLPFALRPLVKRFMLQGILATYYRTRSIVIDFLANLYKEKLDHLVPELLGPANAAIEPAIDADEVRRYYRDDARTWALLQRLRRLDRGWQRKVRRRPYPFILPGPIER